MKDSCVVSDRVPTRNKWHTQVKITQGRFIYKGTNDKGLDTATSSTAVTTSKANGEGREWILEPNR